MEAAHRAAHVDRSSEAEAPTLTLKFSGLLRWLVHTGLLEVIQQRAEGWPRMG